MSNERTEPSAPRPEDGILLPGLWHAYWCACDACCVRGLRVYLGSTDAEPDEDVFDYDTYDSWLEGPHSATCICRKCLAGLSKKEQRERRKAMRNWHPLHRFNGPRPHAPERAEEAEHVFGTTSIPRKGWKVVSQGTEKRQKRRRERRKPETDRQKLERWVRSQYGEL